MDIGEIIGKNLKHLRTQRNLSLSKLAELSGVSKVMLSQIEKGKSNPTVNTIWKITGALGLPYTSLLEPMQNETVHIRKKELTELEDDHFHIFSYYPRTAARNFEVYQIEMEPGTVHESIGHSSDSFEYIMLIDGTMKLTSKNQTYVLEPDDGFYFDASSAHTYENVSDIKLKAVMIIEYKEK